MSSRRGPRLPPAWWWRAPIRKTPFVRAALALVVAFVAGSGCRAHFRTGLDVLEAQNFAPLRGKRIALLTNPTGVNGELESTIDLLAAAPGVDLVAVLGPEHGVRGAESAGEAVADGRDERIGVPVYSLYGGTRRPTPEMLRGVDAVVFDIQDVGVRAYTYLATLIEVLRAAANAGVEVWVLDRPIPTGGGVEGPLLKPEFRSFVGPHTVPLRHGLTPGEFARLVNDEEDIGARLRVVPLEGYRRDMVYEETGRPWVAPSPNIPTVGTALIYAGMVLVEGTNLSEGRGTTRPFSLLGAPWVDGQRLAAALRGRGLEGVLFREADFIPSASKYAGERCHGVEVHVTDPGRFRPVRTAVTVLDAARRLHPDKFSFRVGVFDRLAGSSDLREALEREEPIADVVRSWGQEIEAFRTRRAPYLLYP